MKGKPQYSFRNLAMWQKAQELTLAILETVERVPSTRATSIMVDQIVRSASSIGANIAEGHGRFSAGAYRNHLFIARGSANETIGWLDVLKRAGHLDERTEERPRDLCEETLRMISAQMIKLDKQTGKAGQFRDEREPYAAG